MNTPAVQIRSLTRCFGEKRSVDDLNLEIGQGELYALLGPNGAGKTTTIRMLCCLLMPTSGTATVRGHDIIKEARAVKRILDVSPQETAVAGHLSARENLILMGGVCGLARADSVRRAHQLLEVFGLSNISGQVRTFSGGMQRRLSIAMALMSDPEVLFLDEPTLGLDPEARRGMWRHIETLKGKKTILLTTHYLEEADALADRIGIIKDGKLTTEGTPEELKRSISETKTMTITSAGLPSAGFPSECVDALRERYPSATIDDDMLVIADEDPDVDAVVDILRKHNVKIGSMSTKEPSLEDAYLHLIGVTEREDAE